MKRVRGPEDDHTASIGYACGPAAICMIALILVVTVIMAVCL